MTDLAVAADSCEALKDGSPCGRGVVVHLRIDQSRFPSAALCASCGQAAQLVGVVVVRDGRPVRIGGAA